MSEKDKVNATIYLVIIALIIYVLTVVSIRATKLPLLENRLILIAENDVNYTLRDISNGYVYEVPKGKDIKLLRSAEHLLVKEDKDAGNKV